MTSLGGLRGQIGWMVRGRAHTVGTLEALSNDLRQLQQQVAGLEAAVHDLQRGQAAMGARQLDEFDRVRASLAAATDDLVARVEATQAQVRGSDRIGA